MRWPSRPAIAPPAEAVPGNARLLGGEGGRSLIAAADAWMSGQGIQNPERWAAMLAPGRWAYPA